MQFYSTHKIAIKTIEFFGVGQKWLIQNRKIFKMKSDFLSFSIKKDKIKVKYCFYLLLGLFESQIGGRRKKNLITLYFLWTAEVNVIWSRMPTCHEFRSAAKEHRCSALLGRRSAPIDWWSGPCPLVRTCCRTSTCGSSPSRRRYRYRRPRSESQFTKPIFCGCFI